jgi:hypothetical protein
MPAARIAAPIQDSLKTRKLSSKRAVSKNNWPFLSRKVDMAPFCFRLPDDARHTLGKDPTAISETNCLLACVMSLSSLRVQNLQNVDIGLGESHATHADVYSSGAPWCRDRQAEQSLR